MFENSCDQMMLHYPQRPMESRWKPSVEIAPNCPRCASTNTKFCYYNNYSLSQPRYFCKGCRRYWTKGGSLRNVPVGGGCRKNRRSRPSRSSQIGGGNSGYSNNLSSGSDSTSESPERANIDMADVFAKFLNQNLDRHNHEIVGEDSYSGTVAPLSDLTEEGHLQDVIPRQMFIGEEDEIGEFMVEDTNLLELQEILNDELPQEVSWRDDATTIPSFAWQQDFEPFISNDDELNIPTDVVLDNWSSMPLELPVVGNFFESF